MVASQPAPGPSSRGRVRLALRRWLGRGAPTPPARPDDRADLVADIVTMTRQAAVDGLPLSAVLGDVRLVLRLEPADPLPVDALRACALEWAHASNDRGARPVAAVTLDDLEDHVWGLLGGSPDRMPERAVVVRVQDQVLRRDAGGPRATGALDDADLLGAAARVVSDVFTRPGEHVVLLRSRAADVADRVVALVPDRADDGAGDEDRLALLEASLGAAPLTGVATWDVDVRPLTGHPDGLLAGIREALDAG